MFRFLIALSFALSLMALKPSESPGEDFITKQQRRKRLPTVTTFQSTPMLSRATLFVMEDSRAELKLSEEQGKRIDNLLADWCEHHQAFLQRPFVELPGEAGLSEAEARRRREEAMQQNMEKTSVGFREILNPEQYERFNQLLLQKLGVTALWLREPLIEKLNLEESQKTEIRKAARPGPRRAGQPSAHEKFLALLTPEQRQQWDALIGKPFFAPPSDRRGVRSFSIQLSDVSFPLSLVRHESVRTALQLSDEQQQQIADPVVRWLDARLNWDESLIAGADKNQRDLAAKQIQTAVNEVTKVLQSTLTESQTFRLEQIGLQRAGVFAFRRPEVLKELNLSRDQREKIIALLDEAQSKGQMADDAQQRLNRDALAILTDEQRQKWNEVLGELVTLTADE